MPPCCKCNGQRAGQTLYQGEHRLARQVPLYIKLSDEIGKWGGDIGKAKLPDEFLVDYVRVYDLMEKK